MKKLSSMLKDLYIQSGLDPEGISNKSGRTTCVTRMSAEGVPASIGMKITGHKSQGAYERYDRSKEAQVRAAQRCVGNASDYVCNLVQENGDMKESLIDGKGKAKLVEEPETEMRKTTAAEAPKTGTTEVPVQVSKTTAESGEKRGGPSTEKSVPIDISGGSYFGDMSGESGETEVTMLTVDSKSQSKGASSAATAKRTAAALIDAKWMDDYNWDNLGAVWKEGGAALAPVFVNPIHALFGKIASMNNCSVSINFGAPGGKF